MDYKELAEISQAKNKDLTQTIKSLQMDFESQRLTLESQMLTIHSLGDEIKQLRELLLERDKSTEKIIGKLNSLAKIAFPAKTEKRRIENHAEEANVVTPKLRGNNGAKRKVYENLEEITVKEEVEPTHPEFKKNEAHFISSRKVIRYKYTPPSLKKYIYICNKYSLNGSIYEGRAPIAPIMNSNFDSSVIANLIQQRFVYGMPVERIVRFYNEMGIELPKQTAHGLLTKAAEMLDRLIPTLRDVILSDPYLHFDETYHTIIDKCADNGSRKGYFWAALSSQNNLIHLSPLEVLEQRRCLQTTFLRHTTELFRPMVTVVIKF